MWLLLLKRFICKVVDIIKDKDEEPMQKKSIVIIGSGLAGYMLAKEFRKLDTQTPLQIITANDGRFYSKPQLSTALTAKKAADTLAMASATDMAKQLSAEIRTQTKVSRIDAENQCIYVNDSEEKINYSKLVLACGADIIKPPLVGNAVDAVYSVNDLEDYALFQKKLQNNKHIAILGAGLVGCEFANDLANVGHKVEIIAPSSYPLDTLLPFEIGNLLQNALTENGVTWHLEQLVTSVDHVDQQLMLTLGYQQKLPFDVVLSAIGLKPHVDLAMTADIKVGKGIIVDGYLQTSAANIYALGDCAEVNGLVMLFVAPLLNCARALAKTLAQENTLVEYPAMPVVIKTPACPIVVCPPPRNVEGDWTITGIGRDLKALFYDNEHKQLRGFALTGKAVAEKLSLMKELPACF
jgi:rubredoxin-NAD+ reductase